VAIAARDRAALDATAAELAKEMGRKIVAVRIDTGSRESVDRAVEEAAKALGGIGHPGERGRRPGRNLISAPFVGNRRRRSVARHRHQGDRLPAHRAGRGSPPAGIGLGAHHQLGGLAIHRTGRPVATLRNVGVAAITKNLADELGPWGINVVAVHPGATRTEKTSAEDEARLVQGNSIRRLIDSSEIADLVAFLASPRSIAVNGDAISAGGGSPGTIHY